MNQKQILRQSIREKKREYSREQLQDLSQTIATQLLRHPRVQTATVVLAYSALPDEVDLSLLIQRLVASGKTVLLPKVIGDGLMEVRRYTGPHDLSEGAYHIQEPTGPAFTALDSIEVGLIPGMAFDEAGHRLGRGKGYYDRFLAQQLHIYKIGVAFPFQKVDCVPTDEYDIPMDEVVAAGPISIL